MWLTRAVTTTDFYPDGFGPFRCKLGLFRSLAEAGTNKSKQNNPRTNKGNKTTILSPGLLQQSSADVTDEKKKKGGKGEVRCRILEGVLGGGERTLPY